LTLAKQNWSLILIENSGNRGHK